MSEDKVNSIPDLPCLILRAILNSKSLDDFCKRLSLVVTDTNWICSIRELVHLESVEVLGSDGNNAKTKQTDYPREIRANLIRSLINGSPAWFHKNNQIWSQGEFGSDFVSGGPAVLIIPLPNELENPIWLEFQQNYQGSQIRINTEVINILQLALALKLGSSMVNENSAPSFDSQSFWETFDLTTRQKLITKLISEGATNNQIANHLHVSQSLVKLEIGRIFKVLNLRKRGEISDLFVHREGLEPPTR